MNDSEKYFASVEKTNKAITEINARIRASNGWDWPGARFGVPKETANQF